MSQPHGLFVIPFSLGHIPPHCDSPLTTYSATLARHLWVLSSPRNKTCTVSTHSPDRKGIPPLEAKDRTKKKKKRTAQKKKELVAHLVLNWSHALCLSVRGLHLARLVPLLPKHVMLPPRGGKPWFQSTATSCTCWKYRQEGKGSQSQRLLQFREPNWKRIKQIEAIYFIYFPY